ncbi:HAMP domain-containing histidine kinase [Acaryochloris sp. 'Moss Beach']|nr:HAMP domain-containing histidine kinase [Acaryochloris sp. 'Moss Beach']
MLYLQNQSTAGVFTCDRITVLNFLCSQAAIALENARLFSKRLDIEAELQQLNAQLDQRVKERTQELSETLETLKSAQVSLIEAEKMAALGTLVAGVAHEINTPIGTSITVASTLAAESEQFLQAAENGQLRRSTLNQYLEVVRQCTQLLNSNLSRAGDLIQSFKQVAIDQSHQELRTFNLKAYVEEVVTSLQPQVKHSGHQLRVSGDEWITLIHDPGVVAQLITNLVTNSIKHAYAEGETGQLQIQIKQQEQRAFMTYSDDGCGIPPANLSKVYEPFFTTARHRGGTGLGLNIVYNIVTQSLQGTIQIDSQVGQGTTFTIAIPYKPDLKAR